MAEKKQVKKSNQSDNKKYSAKDKFTYTDAKQVQIKMPKKK